ncbi:MAG: DNA polymerase I, partial [Planctomycetota bacterium]|nr:DNA polymerase I [Planctomycetota bacterium]
MKKRFFIIDGHSYLYQAFYAIRGLSGPKGEPTNAIYGFISMILLLLKKEKPDCLAVTFDRPEPSFRHKTYPTYKANRKPMPQELSLQIPVIEEIVTAYRLPVYSSAGYEADDVIATIVKSVPEDTEVFIISRDKDLKQLLRSGVSFYDTKTSSTSGVEEFMKEYGFEPSSFADYLALCGDKSDNIPGVTGIGEKTAQELIAKYKTLENLYAHLGELPSRTAKKLQDGKESAFLSRDLVKVRSNAPLPFNLEECKIKPPDREKLLQIFQRYNFKKFMEELKSEENLTVAEEKTDYRLVNDEESLKEMLDALKGVREIAVDTETTSENEHTCTLVGISLTASAGKGFYIPVRAPMGEKHLPKETVLRALKPILEDEKVAKFGQNMKYLRPPKGEYSERTLAITQKLGYCNM